MLDLSYASKQSDNDLITLDLFYASTQSDHDLINFINLYIFSYRK